MIMVDANIFMDVLGQRSGAVQSGLVISMVKKKKIAGAVSAMTILILWFMESRRKYVSSAFAKANVKAITKGFKILPLTSDAIEMAFGSVHEDFEDAAQLHIALASKCEAVITRNKKDFLPSAGMKVLTPEEFLSESKKR